MYHNSNNNTPFVSMTHHTPHMNAHDRRWTNRDQGIPIRLWKCGQAVRLLQRHQREAEIFPSRDCVTTVQPEYCAGDGFVGEKRHPGTCEYCVKFYVCVHPCILYICVRVCIMYVYIWKHARNKICTVCERWKSGWNMWCMHLPTLWNLCMRTCVCIYLYPNKHSYV